MQSRPNPVFQLAIFGLCLVTGSFNCLLAEDLPSREKRMTPIVRAVANCNMSVVNIRGRKTISVDSADTAKKRKQVNGMGTGVVIDSRGYVLTNYHVVEGVRTIEITTADRQKTTAKLLAHDPETDLAVLKIETRKPLPRIAIGTSSDLMLAEQVIAVGNAYGYEHTVTLGIISSLSRTVQVNDEQIYRNLIQTDAAINPGNSGGPLLNTNGEMIGINVAVRIGAQGIAFAIPVNDAIEVAADLLEEISVDELYHGLNLQTKYVNDRSQLRVLQIADDSPAEKIGMRPGAQIISVNGEPVATRLDFQTALLRSKSTGRIVVSASHNGEVEEHEITLKRNPVKTAPVVSASALAWTPLGLKLTTASEAELRNRHPNYKKGLRVTQVRPNSPAETEGIMPGDILVAMHGWKTESLENLAYILQRPDIVQQKKFMFYILRDKEPFWGQMRVAQLPR
ncbi:MAG: trypsin-like peptidase domain-containing protein [Planctomycetota bacterium]